MNRFRAWLLCLAVVLSLLPGKVLHASEPEPSLPIAHDMTVTTKENTPILGMKALAEGDGTNALFFYVIEETQNGMLDFLEHGVFSYTPNSGFVGTDTFRFKAKIGQRESNIATVTIKVEPGEGANREPIAKELNLMTTEKIEIDGQLVATDEDGDALRFHLVQQPGKGEVSLDERSGSFRYTPLEGAVGMDTFTFQASDGKVNSNVATVSIMIRERENHAPVANNLSISTVEKMPTKAWVGATDEDGDALSYVLQDEPRKGDLQFYPGGMFIYTPRAGATGNDTFTFYARDGKADSNLANVLITIQPHGNGNHAPFAHDVSIKTVNWMPVTGYVKATDIDNDTLQYKLDQPPAFGSLVFNEDSGMFRYSPGPDSGNFETFTYRVFDGELYSDYATVMVTIETVENNPPHAEPLSISTKEGTPVTGRVIATDADEDVLYYDILDQGAKGLVTMDGGTGSFTYTPREGETGVDTFAFMVNDGKNYSNLGIVTITIEEDSGHEPIQVPDIMLETQANRQVQTKLTATAPEGAEVHFKLVSEPTKPADVKIEGDRFTYTPKAGESGTDTLRYQAMVGENQSNIGTITIKIGKSPQPPYFPVTDVQLDKTQLTMLKGSEPVLVRAKVFPTYATNPTVSWKSSAPDVATVDQNGLVTAHGKGKAIITVTTLDGNHTATCTVQVTSDPELVRLEAVEKGLLLKPDKSFVPKVYAVYDNGERVNITDDRQNITYESSDTKVVSVNGKTLRTGKKEGEAVLTISYGGLETDVLVMVSKNRLKSLKPSVKKIELRSGETEKITLTANLSNRTTKDVTELATWTSSNPEVATVENGTITALQQGVVTIKASFGGRKVEVRVIIQ